MNQIWGIWAVNEEYIGVLCTILTTFFVKLKLHQN